VRRELSVDEFVAGVRGGDRAVLGRALTLVESQRREHRRAAQEVLQALQPHSGAGHRVGISGVPGVGKSTFIEGLGLLLVGRGLRVAVLAVDPSSSISGGSILGDKTRMAELATDERAFIRPSPASGTLGGVARATRESIVVCEAAGYDVILVETVGVGQSEALVADMTDCFLLLMLSGAGDELQGIKRGILELADVLAINKADGANRTAAARARTELERALAILRPPAAHGWAPRVVTCSAREREGLAEIWDLVQEHRRLLEGTGRFADKRRRQRLSFMWSLVEEALKAALHEHAEVAALLPGLERDVLAGRTTPTRAAELILAAFGLGACTALAGDQVRLLESPGLANAAHAPPDAHAHPGDGHSVSGEGR
jgi:LAO/AO transport system kinase